jgi:hypothetical protein
MDDAGLKIGQDRVSSQTHIILFDLATAGMDEAANRLNQALHDKFGRAPLVCPSPVWTRSCALHEKSGGAGKVGKPRIPFFVGCIDAADSELRKYLCLDETKDHQGVFVHRYVQKINLEGYGEVELVDHAVIFNAKDVGGINLLVNRFLDQIGTNNTISLDWKSNV